MGHIEDVVTDKNYRNMGYGKIIVERLVRIALDEKICYKVVLNCKEELDSFYTKCGMTKTGSSFSIYKN